MFKAYIYITILSGMLFMYACSPAGGNARGHEFMPDMVHSTAYEANIYNYYYYNTWGSEEEYKTFVIPRKPVAGTIARGYASIHYAGDQKTRLTGMKNFSGEMAENAVAMTPNGAVPYYYENTEEERTRAMAEIIENPYPITESGLAEGKALYEIYCGICHGTKGDGLGYLVRDANPATGDAGGKYPAAPANFLLDEFVTASNGRYYHSIMYGKNVMGAYADKLSYEERWQVIHYIRALQAKSKGLVYNEMENTLNTVDIPGAAILAEIQEEMKTGQPAGDAESIQDSGEGHDHDGEDTGNHEGDH